MLVERELFYLLEKGFLLLVRRSRSRGTIKAFIFLQILYFCDYFQKTGIFFVSDYCNGASLLSPRDCGNRLNSIS